MTQIVVVIPVLNRPDRIRPLIDNITAVTATPHRILFVASPNDSMELRGLVHEGADHIVIDRVPGPGDYSRKINLAYRMTTEPFIFTGADDLLFHEGWDIEALQHMKLGIGVVGTNDLGNPAVMRGEHSTHSLIARWYADEQGVIDSPGSIYCEKYHHLFVDDELVSTAKYRNAWSFASNSHVEHLHPHLRDAANKPKGIVDSTYRRAFSKTGQDRRVFRQRQHLWGDAVRPQRTAPISVIVATYGSDSWKQLALDRALPSVASQSYQAAQTIAIHGKSLAEARNEGAAQATAKWLCFLDADDELDSAFLASMVRYTHSNAGLLNPAVQFIHPEGPKPVKMFSPRDLKNGNYLVIGTVVRADLFRRAGGFDPQWRAYEDWQLWRKVDSLGGRIVRVPNAIYRAYWNETSRNNTVEDKHELMEEMKAEFEEWKEGLNDHRARTHRRP